MFGGCSVGAMRGGGGGGGHFLLVYARCFAMQHFTDLFRFVEGVRA